MSEKCSKESLNECKNLERNLHKVIELEKEQKRSKPSQLTREQFSE